MIPDRANCFQNRVEVTRLRQALAAGGTAVVGQVLTGMGGVGKTQLAADYARDAQARGTVDVLVWITASDGMAAVSGYGQAGIEVLGADPTDLNAAAREFLAWLEPKAEAKPCRWLVMLDDVADPADLAGLWPPTSPHGRTLVTTRRRDAALTGAGRVLIEVGLFTRAEAVSYLNGVLAAHGRTEPDDHLAALAEDLGRLPLALSQAAAYLVDSGETTASYRMLLADRTTTLADAAPDVLPDSQTRSMAAAWSLSVDRADTLPPAGLARPMLQLTAFLAPNGIPDTVLTSVPSLVHLTTHSTKERQGQVLVRDAVRALRVLHRLNLIDHRRDTPHASVRMHQLVQRATRDTLNPYRHDQTARTAADALMAAWPDIERDTALAESLRANTAALTKNAEDALYRPTAHIVLERTGRSLGEGGQFTAARAHYQHLFHALCHYLGDDHPNTLATRSNLARWQGEAGDAAGAAAAFTDMVPHMARALGEDHPHTLAARNSLARWRGSAGNAAGAAAATADLLPHMARVLGEDHHNTLIARVNLAFWYGAAGDAAGAAAATADLLPHMMRVLGEDHPETLTARYNLAVWRGEAGDAAGAAATYTDLLPHMVQVLGEDHPRTLFARVNLAHWRGEAGDAAGAAAATADLLPNLMRVLGEDHPETLTARGNLAFWQGRGGDPAGAAATCTDLLPHMMRVLGEDHPDTLSVRSRLAHWLADTGDAAKAAAAFADVLDDRVRVLGEDHPNTLTARHNLAFWRGETGDAAQAAAAFADLLPHMVRVLGEDHPHTLVAQHNLARWRGETGDAAQAAAAFADLLPHMVRVLGEDHPHTVNTRLNLAYWRGQAGQDDSATR